MSFPSVISRTDSQTAANNTSHTVSFGATPSTGELLLVVAIFDGNPTVTWPANWISLTSQVNGTACKLEIRYKVASGEGSSISLTTSSTQEMQARAWRISGFQGTPEAGTAATGISANPNPPNVAPSWGAKDNLFIAVEGCDAARAATAFPANYTQTGTANSGGTTDGVGLGWGERQLNAASDDPGTFTITSDDWVAQTIVIRGLAVQTVTGTSTNVGTLIKLVSTTKTGVSSSSGVVTKLVSKLVSGSSTNVGSLSIAKLFSKLVSGLSTSSGTLQKVAQKLLTASSSNTGQVQKTILKTLLGAINPIGAIQKVTGKVLQGIANSIGDLSKQISIGLTSTLPLSGSESNTLIPVGGTSSGINTRTLGYYIRRRMR